MPTKLSGDQYKVLDYLRTRSDGVTLEEIESRIEIWQLEEKPDNILTHLVEAKLVRFDRGCEKHPAKYNPTNSAWQIWSPGTHTISA
jgi:hypothetical protein